MNNLLRLKNFSFLILVLILFTTPIEKVIAQDSTSAATLLGWEQRVRNFMLDRAHNYGGTHFNRGLFREHLNVMSPEHNIDLLTYRFTLLKDYQFEQAKNVYRMTIGSLNATNFAAENTIKSAININERNQFLVEGYHAENFRAARFLFHLGYKYNLTKKHQIGLRHSVSNAKEDLDATFFYRYGDFNNGMIQFDVSFLDWASNTVQELAKDSRNEWNRRYDVTYQYKNHPELLSVKLISPKNRNLRAELLGGLQTYSRKKVEQHADTTSYSDQEWAHYVGGLLEYSMRYITIGVTYQRTFSKLRRKPAGGSDFANDFTNWQITNQFGAYATGQLKDFRLEQWIWYGHNIDRLQGKTVPGDLRPEGRGFERIPFDFVEKPIMLKSRVLYDPIESGFRTGLAFHAEYIRPQGEKASNGIRDYDFRRTYSIIKNYNERLTLTLGYRINPNFYLLGGISYDVDGDKQSGVGHPKLEGISTWFDGGFGRLSISW